MNIDLNFDEDLGRDAEAFGFITDEAPVAQSPEGTVISHEVMPVITPTRAAHDGNVEEAQLDASYLDDAVALVMEICFWECTFYTWCEEYLHGGGEKDAVMAGIPYVRDRLSVVRHYWGPRYFRFNQEMARDRYFAVIAAQAVLSAVERRNKDHLIQKAVYYASLVSGRS